MPSFPARPAAPGQWELCDRPGARVALRGVHRLTLVVSEEWTSRHGGDRHDAPPAYSNIWRARSAMATTAGCLSFRSRSDCPSLWLWLPYTLYRRSHLEHHATPVLTQPGRDPESFYLPPATWARLPAWRRRILELKANIAGLEAKTAAIAAGSEIARRVGSIPGFGATSSAELAGEIGTLERFASEASLALYVGMAALDNRSGKIIGTRSPRQVNTRAKAAMMAAVARHIDNVPSSRAYYEKKRAEGKKHNQAIRALGRHLCRVIFKMLDQDRPYRIDP